MKYRDIIGYSKSEKKIIKEEVKPKSRVNKVLNNIKQELNESNVALGIQTLKDNPPFKTEKQIEEGPSYEYEPHLKKIDKYYDAYWKAVQDFGKVLEKKGMKKESKFMHQKYYKHVVEFKAWFTTFIKELL